MGSQSSSSSYHSKFQKHNMPITSSFIYYDYHNSSIQQDKLFNQWSNSTIISFSKCSSKLPIYKHQYILFQTDDHNFFTLEKNNSFIVIQKSTNKQDCSKKYKGRIRQQPNEQTKISVLFSQFTAKDLFIELFKNLKVNEDPYNFFNNNCIHFADLISKTISFQGLKQISLIQHQIKHIQKYYFYPSKINKAFSQKQRSFFLFTIYADQFIDKKNYEDYLYFLIGQENGAIQLLTGLEKQKNTIICNFLQSFLNTGLFQVKISHLKIQKRTTIRQFFLNLSQLKKKLWTNAIEQTFKTLKKEHESIFEKKQYNKRKIKEYEDQIKKMKLELKDLESQEQYKQK